eukprot:ctg_360.g238
MTSAAASPRHAPARAPNTSLDAGDIEALLERAERVLGRADSEPRFRPVTFVLRQRRGGGGGVGGGAGVAAARSHPIGQHSDARTVVSVERTAAAGSVGGRRGGGQGGLAGGAGAAGAGRGFPPGHRAR